jgi:hypothetical protein
VGPDCIMANNSATIEENKSTNLKSLEFQILN